MNFIRIAPEWHKFSCCEPGFICDDTLFLKTGSALENDLNDAWLGPCYPGSKDYYGIPGDCLEDHEWLQTHVQAVADSL